MNWVLDADICPEYHFFRCSSQLMYTEQRDRGNSLNMCLKWFKDEMSATFIKCILKNCHVINECAICKTETRRHMIWLFLYVY